MKILYYTASGLELPSLAEAYRQLRAEGLSLKLVVRSPWDLEGEVERKTFYTAAQEAHAVVLLPHGGEASLPGLKELLAAAGKASLIHVQPVGRSDEDLLLVEKYARPKGDAFSRRLLYLKHGGPENLKNFLLHLWAELEGGDLPPPPKPLPTEGLYHPEGGFFEAPEDYLSWLSSRGLETKGRPLVGIWFYQGLWVNGDLAPIKALVEEIEARGGVAWPVFHRRFAEDEALAPEEVARRFFGFGKETRIQALINLQPFSHRLLWPETEKIYPSLNLPVLQGILSYQSRRLYEESDAGLSPLELALHVAQPEFDGVLITTLAGTREPEEDSALGIPLRKYLPWQPGVRRLVGLALNWAWLRLTPPERRRIAIVFHHYPPRSDRMGCAFGLDSFESVARLIRELKKEGYRVERVYESGEEIARELRAALLYDRRYLDPASAEHRAAARIKKDDLLRWHGQRPEKTRKELEAHWGEPPGKLFVCREGLLISGVRNGHLFLTLQPPRGLHEKLEEEAATDVHDPHLPPTHHYLAFYRWLREGFGAQAVIHVGKHGTLEWLPGKAVALSPTCYPDLALEELPNIYPYIVNDPGEGTQAKRRSYCAIIDHMIPPQMTAGRYGELEELARLLEEHRILARENPPQAEDLAREIVERALSQGLHEDLGLGPEEVRREREAFFKRLHEYLEQVASTLVNDGLHVLGVPPQGKAREETLSALARYSKEGIEALERRLEGVREEMKYLLAALSGGFVPPGPSGAPTRGETDVLPTGRNFYSVDPRKIPTRTAWERGVRQARALLERHLRDHGRFPASLAMVIWGSPTMRTRGEDFACALYLLGVRPRWHPASQRVLSVEIIPLQELGRPRIDVTLRTSGFFRDAFPNLMELFDQAVRMVALLKEPEEKNYLAAHFRRDLKEHLARGLSREEASRRAGLRVFSDPPGAYGTGISQVLDTGSWNDRQELAEVYLRWSGYAYGQGIYGLEAREDLSRVLSRVEVTYRNDDTRELDLLSCDCPNAYHGGLNVAVEALSGKKPLSYSGSTADPERPEVKTTAEEIRFLFRTKVLNPRWIEGMKRHGYKGAGDLSRLIDYCFQWDATSDVLSDWMYERLAETYAFSEEMQAFFLKHNPAALLNIAERLLEAARRGLWKAPSKEYLERLENLFLEMEAILE